MTLPLDDLQDWRYKVDAEGIAWAVFDRAGEKMNIFGRRPTLELARIVEAVEKAAALGDVIGLIFMSAKRSNFVAGADIREFEDIETEQQARDVVMPVMELFDRIENLRIPVIAAIHGYCLGGGLEFALACDYRIADRSDATRIGFPEVKLGIIPGIHGTVRAIFRAGPVHAMSAMLSGRMLRASAAKRAGFVDQLVDTHHNLRWAARRAVLQKRSSKPIPLMQKLLLGKTARSLLARNMRKKTAARVREDHYPAPFRLIDLFETHGGNRDKLRRGETDVFAKLMASDTSRNLRRVFALSELLKKQVKDKSFRPLRVHVVGAGTMGGDIAAWCVAQGMEASLQDLDPEQIETARLRARKLFDKRLKKKRAMEAAMARLIADPQGDHVKRADVVIEAIVENLEIKRTVLAKLERSMRRDAVLATNTSSLRIEDIASALEDKSRLIGLHFFNPVAKMPLVEIVRGRGSNVAMVEKGAAFVARIKKTPLIVASAPGFLVNRVLAPYMMAAIARVEDGLPAELIDEAALDFGMPMGPIELADVVGLDIMIEVGKSLDLASPEGNQLEQLVASGHLGKKSGQGFYKWKNGEPVKKPAVNRERETRQLGLELLQPLIDEAYEVLDERIVETADLIDAGVIFGTGFAPFTGGPLHYDIMKKAGGAA